MCKGPELGDSITHRGTRRGGQCERCSVMAEERKKSGACLQANNRKSGRISCSELGQNTVSLASWYPLLSLFVGAGSPLLLSELISPLHLPSTRILHSTCSSPSSHQNQPLHLVLPDHQWPQHSLGPAGINVEGQCHHPLLQVQQSKVSDW